MAKITRRSYKRNKVTYGIALFTGIALVSTGFAAFVISSATKQSSSGNLDVGITKNNVLKITNTTDSSQTSFCFEPVKSTTENDYCIKPLGTEEEKLSVVLTGKIENASRFKKLTFKMDNHVGASRAIANNYIVGPACYNNEFTLYEKDNPSKPLVTSALEDGVKLEEDGSYTFKYTVSFSWGSKFQSRNPAVYYTEQLATKSEEEKANYLSEAEVELDKMRADFCNVDYETNYKDLSDDAKEALPIENYKIVITGYVD